MPRDRRIPAIAALVVFGYVLFPGDVPWILDEPKLFAAALEANRTGTLARLGLEGTAGYRYGPLPTWIYQALLALSGNPNVVVALKILITVSALAAALLGLRRTLGLPPWPLTLIALSPYLYFYQRVPWDNCFLIPLSALFFLALARFLEKPTAAAYAGAIACAVAALHVHLVAVLSFGPALAVALVVRRRWLLAAWPTAVAIIVAGFAVCYPYLAYLLSSETIAQPSAPSPANLALLAKGAIFFGFVDFFQYFLPELLSSLGSFQLVVLTLTLTATVPIMLHAEGVVRGARSRDPFAIACLAAIVGHTGYFVASGRDHYPHYLNAPWFAYFYFVWVAAAHPWRATLKRQLLAVHLAATAALLALFAGYVHRNGGSRGVHYGTVLKEQVRVARQSLGARVRFQSDNYRFNPDAFEVLVDLEGGRDAAKRDAVVVIRYREPANPYSAWLSVECPANGGFLPIGCDSRR